MNKTIKALLDFMENEFDFNVGRVTNIVDTDINSIIITIDDKYDFEVSKGLENNAEAIKNIAYYIIANIPTNFEIKEDDSQPVEKDDTTAEEVEDLTDVTEGEVYKFIPDIIVSGNEEFENENKLADLAKMNLYCKVLEKLITSKDEDDGFVLVTFDIPENNDKKLPDYAKENFVVFVSDLKPVVDDKAKVKESFGFAELDYDPASIVRHPNASYVAKDARITDDCLYLDCYDKEYDDYFDMSIGEPGIESTIANAISLLDDMDLDIEPEVYEKLVNLHNKEVKIKEDINSDNYDSTQELITALASEREAVIIYQTLIEHSTDTEEIELLSKILDDEKEHIALLSSLQAKQTAMFVADDNKDMLDNYAEDTIDTAPLEEDK